MGKDTPKGKRWQKADGFEKHPVGKLWLGETMCSVLRCGWRRKEPENLRPKRGEDPGLGNLARQKERQSERMEKSQHLSSCWRQRSAGTPLDKVDTRGAKCGMFHDVALSGSESRGSKIF